jgi:outer membrane lipoprotein-sorting protein
MGVRGQRFTRTRLAVAAVALLAVMIGISLVPGWLGANAVNAETILDRASTSATSPAAVRTYHIVTQRSGDQTVTSEVWFGGADRQRTLDRVTAASGAVVRVQDVIFDGAQTWVAITENGQTRAVHTIGTTWTRPAEDPAALTSIADLMSRFGQKSCGAANLESSNAVVAGQTTYVVALTPQANKCEEPVAGRVLPGREALSQMHVRLWIDKQSFLLLKMEMRDGNGVVRARSEATTVEYNIAIPDSTFVYTPPAGVAVSTFNGGDADDVKKALADQAESKLVTPRQSP